MKKKKKTMRGRSKTRTAEHSHTQVMGTSGGETIAHAVGSGESWGIIDPHGELMDKLPKRGGGSQKK